MGDDDVTNQVTSRGGTATVSTDLRIKAAAVSLFAQYGYAGTSIRDIAKVVGIRTASIYHFFESKEAVLIEILREGQHTLNLHAMQILDGVDRPEDRLALLVTELAGAHGISPMVNRVTDGEMRAFDPASSTFRELVASRDVYERFWSEAIDQGIDEGIFQVRDARVTRLGLMAMCTGVSEWYRADGPSSLVDICRTLTDIALASVHAARGGKAITSSDVRLFDATDFPRPAWDPQLVSQSP